jgi:hypothetical protein
MMQHTTPLTPPTTQSKRGPRTTGGLVATMLVVPAAVVIMAVPTLVLVALVSTAVTLLVRKLIERRREMPTSSEHTVAGRTESQRTNSNPL